MFGPLLDLIHPPLCLVCTRPTRGAPLCSACGIPSPERCVSCERGEPLEHEPACPWSTGHRPVLTRLGVPFRTVGAYSGPLRELILGAKWRGRGDALRHLADRATETLREDAWWAGLDGWVAVPRSRWRRLRHGRSLAEALGMEIGWRLRLPAVRGLGARHGLPQARRSGLERRRSRRMFTVRHPERFAGRRLLLVDDVVTTGTTLAAALREMERAGVRETRALALAVPS